MGGVYDRILGASASASHADSSMRKVLSGVTGG